MTAKLFGSLLLVGAGLYIALLLARYEHRRVGVLDGYLSLLRFIRGQIDCFSMPIGQILATVDPSVLAACRGQDRASAERPAASLPLLLHESRGYLGAESERLLTCFARELGHTHRAEQVGRCDYYLSALEEQRGRLADSLPARMDISLIIKVAGVGLLVAVACQLLSKAGRDEQSMLVTLAGIVVVLLLLIQQIADLFELICTVFGF